MNDEVLDGLEPMFKEAEEKGLWFYCFYQAMWFSPTELREEQANGKFRWGAVNWKLRNPQDELKSLDKKIDDEIKRRDAFLHRIQMGA